MGIFSVVATIKIISCGFVCQQEITLLTETDVMAVVNF